MVFNLSGLGPFILIRLGVSAINGGFGILFRPKDLQVVDQREPGGPQQNQQAGELINLEP